jgi:hypothetical protein
MIFISPEGLVNQAIKDTIEIRPDTDLHHFTGKTFNILLQKS